MLKRPFSVLVIIENSDGEFLLIQRADDATFWQSVTGGIEQNETALECAYREVFEETGIDCEASGYKIVSLNITNQYEIRKDWRYRYEKESYLNTEYVFYLNIDSQTQIKLAPKEHLSFKWLNYQNTLQLLSSETNKNAVELIYKSKRCK